MCGFFDWQALLFDDGVDILRLDFLLGLYYSVAAFLFENAETNFEEFEFFLQSLQELYIC